MTNHMFSSIGESADRKLHELTDTSRKTLNNIKRKSLEELYRDTKGWVRKNPGKTLVGTMATGVLIGWLLRRRS